MSVSGRTQRWTSPSPPPRPASNTDTRALANGCLSIIECRQGLINTSILRVQGDVSLLLQPQHLIADVPRRVCARLPDTPTLIHRRQTSTTILTESARRHDRNGISDRLPLQTAKIGVIRAPTLCIGGSSFTRLVHRRMHGRPCVAYPKQIPVPVSA